MRNATVIADEDCDFMVIDQDLFDSTIRVSLVAVIISILIKHESSRFVCMFVHVFRSYKKSQFHEILTLGLIWANLKHDDARFSKF